MRADFTCIALDFFSDAQRCLRESQGNLFGARHDLEKLEVYDVAGPHAVVATPNSTKEALPCHSAKAITRVDIAVDGYIGAEPRTVFDGCKAIECGPDRWPLGRTGVSESALYLDLTSRVASDFFSLGGLSLSAAAQCSSNKNKGDEVFHG